MTMAHYYPTVEKRHSAPDVIALVEMHHCEAQGELRAYTELMLASWMARFPELLPEEAELVVETIDPQKTRIYVQRREHHA